MNPETVSGGALVAHIGIIVARCDSFGRPRNAALGRHQTPQPHGGVGPTGSQDAASQSPPRASRLPGPTPRRSRSPWNTSTANRYEPPAG
jgi:hypothetical protein